MSDSNSNDNKALQKEYMRLSFRRDELTKQDMALKKLYTTLLRKISSLTRILEQIDSIDITDYENPKLISTESLKMVPELKWYNDQINLIESLSNINDFEMTEELSDSYNLFKETPLLYKDSLNNHE